MPHTYTNGIVTFYEDSGEGPAVVLIHGHAADLRMWEDQVGALTASGYRVVRYDVRGHGRSMIPPEGYTWANYSADLGELLERLNVERPAEEGLGVDSTHVVGLSMGGGIALQFALDHPGSVRSLTLVDSALPGFSYSEEFSQQVQEVVEAVQREGVRAGLERVYLAHPMFDGIRRFPDRFRRLSQIVLGYQAPEYREGYEHPAEQPAITDRLAEIKAPSLVVVGEDDVPDFQLIAEIMAATMPGARLAVMEGCGHLPPLEVPEQFNEALTRFLADVDGRSGS